jgi:signal transduction histidine kinase
MATPRNRKKRNRPNQLATSKPAKARKPRPSQPVDEGSRNPFSRLGRFLPRTLQGRLSLAFTMVFAVAVGLVSVLTVVVLDTDLRAQEQTNLETRANAVAAVVQVKAETAAETSPSNATVVSASGTLNEYVRTAIDASTLTDWANNVARADLRLRFGFGSETGSGVVLIPAVPVSTFSAALTVEPGRGQARDPISYVHVFEVADPGGIQPTWSLEVSLSEPYTTRDSTITAVIGFLLIVALGALFMAIIVAMLLARRFTLPLRRLTDAAQALAEGDLAQRVPVDPPRTGASEITDLSRQFNAMAEQVEETMEVIRRDRDASREFLADVSHELRTPLAALRTFNELLREKAGDDVAARAEFLESSAQQIERLDWLAQNLLELSKMDSGLIRLDLRPDDLRATVLSAVEQAQVSAQKRGINLAEELPDSPLVTRHDPQRLGQVLTNLIGNALKFTPRGGSVKVVLSPQKGGARVSVTDTGIGIDAKELPRIFERFYRGSRASEARSSGSGLGLAIVRSIVEMHRGRILVESRVGAGSTFSVILPADPRTAPEPAADTVETDAAVPTGIEAQAVAGVRAGAGAQPGPEAASDAHPESVPAPLPPDKEQRRPRTHNEAG